MTAATSTVDPPDPSSHVLTVPVSDEELCESVAAFLAGGIAAGERVTYFDDDTGDAVLARLHDDGIDVDGPLRTGQFQLVPGELTRAVLHAPPDELDDLLQHHTRSALDDGWAGLRLTGQLDHGLRRPGGSQLEEYDRVLDEAVRGRPVHVLCVYDHARYPDDLVAHMRATHEIEIGTAPLYDDTMLRIVESGPGELHLAGEVDHGNRPQVRRVLGRVLDRVARGEIDTDTVVADLSSLRFCDVAAAVSVVHAGEELPATTWLRLENVRPGVARLLERCGASSAGQVRVETRDRDPLDTADAVRIAGGAPA